MEESGNGEDSSENSGINHTTSILQRINQPLFMVLLGLIIASLPVLVLLIQTQSVISAIWPHAINTLDWTMWARTHVAWMPLFFFCCVSVAYAFRTTHIKDNRPIQALTEVCIGIQLWYLFLYFLLNVFYLRGAFLLLPTVYSAILITLLFARFGAPTYRTISQDSLSFTRLIHIGSIFACAWLLLPGLPASFGMAPSPPPAPLIGYGAEPGPFQSTEVVIDYELPQEVENIRGQTERDIDFSIYLRLPVLNESEHDEIPLAIVLHGFLYPDVNAYDDWLNHLSAKGMAVAFIQYPSDIWPEGAQSFDPTEEKGVSDFLQHVPRQQSIEQALFQLNSSVLSDRRDQRIDDAIGSIKISPDFLWIGGHSLGAAYTFFVLEHAINMNWGSKALMIDLESPAPRPSQAELQPTWTQLPDNTIIHSVVTEDDMSVGSCAGAYMHDMFEGVNESQRVFIEIPSDKYGFPRLVASHYLQTDPAHDTLSDWSFYRRLDAQADWLVAESRNDTFTIDWSRNYLLDESLLAPLGSWSDGTPVLPLRIFFGEDSNIAPYQDC